MEKALEIVCENIQIFRKRKKLTQPQLAKLAKINLKTVQRAEQKRGGTSWTTIQLIAEALEMSPFKLTTPIKEKK